MASIRVTPPLVIAAGAIFPPLCAILVGLRFYCRRTHGGRYGWDDFLSVPALIFLIGVAAATLNGVAKHAIAYPTPEVAGDALTATSFAESITKRTFVATELLQVLGLGCTKISAIFFYRHAFAGRSGRGLDIASWSAIAFIAAWTLAFFFGLLFQCGRHVDYLDTDLANEQKCSTATAGMQISVAVTDTFTDLVALLFPVPFIWKMHLTWRRGLAMYAVFLVGILAVMASATRLAIYIEVLTVELSSAPPDPDLLTSAGIYFQLLEAGLALCAVCLPSIYPLFARHSLKSLMQAEKRDLQTEERKDIHEDAAVKSAAGEVPV